MRNRKNLAGVITVLAVVAASLTIVCCAAAQTETVLYRFSAADGYPGGGLIQDASGNLYGTTNDGPTYRGGTVFELTPGTGGVWTHTVLHNFSGGTDGFEPLAGLALDAAGNLYGTTVEGGGGSCARGSVVVGCGTVFELTSGVGGVWIEKILHVFGVAQDGIWPSSNLVFDTAGDLYGTTSLGGSHVFCYMWDKIMSGCGTVFELKPNRNGTWTEKILHNFGSGDDGQVPITGVVFDAAGNLYGSTSTGGPPECGENGQMQICGTIFELIPEGTEGWREKQVTIGDAGFTTNLAIDSVANLYVSADSGGGCGNDYNIGCGIAYEITPTGYGGTIGDFGSGSSPSALTLDAQGNVYGTAENASNYAYDKPVVYESSRNASGDWIFSVIYEEGGNGGSLVRDAAGNLYGAVGAKGAPGYVYEITP
jgi:hypothetical protein